MLVSTSTFAEINLKLQKQLLLMEASDQQIRKAINQSNMPPSSELIKQSKQIDEQNTRQLKQIIATYGWPNKQLVGLQGVAATFLIIQHSADLKFKTSMLPNLQFSFKNKEGISGQQLALLTDKILTANGEKQSYGTQYDLREQQIVFRDIDDLENVDQRRSAIKLPPLSFYKKILEEMHGLKDHPEIDLN